MRAIAATGSLFLFSVLGIAQPAFEAADVHVSAPGATESEGFLPNGRLEFHATTLLHLISVAYSVPPERIAGGPAWIDTDRFDVLAQAPASATQPAMRRMLQPLLAERFGLSLERGEKPFPAFALTLARRGILKEGSGDSDCRAGSEENVRTLSCRNITIAALTERLLTIAPGYFNLPVVDRTGLTGSFDFSIRYLPRGQVPPGGEGSSMHLFNVLEKQLGIKVERQNVPMPVYTIGNVDRTPSPNPAGTLEKLGPPPTEFDAVDIHPSRPNENPDVNLVNGRLDARAVTLRELIAFAYNVEEDWVRGEKWIETDRFDIVAKSALTESDDTFRVMVQALLADRFRLKLHKEPQPVTIYALTAAKSKLRNADPAARATCTSGAADGLRTLTCQNTTMAQFAEKLRPVGGGYLDRPVIDLTGLTGAYDFALSWTPRNRLMRASGDDSAPIGFTLFEAIDRQLGLKLSVQKHPMPVVIIDRIERKPTEN